MSADHAGNTFAVRTGGRFADFRKIVDNSASIGYTSDMAQLWDQVRAAIAASGQTRYRIAKATGVTQAQLSRLMSGERGLRMEALERLADYLSLEIIVRPKRRPRKR